MRNENIIALPASTNYTAEQALASTLDLCRRDNVQDVLIVGYDEAGQLIVRSSRMSRADAVFLLEKAKAWAINGGHE